MNLEQLRKTKKIAVLSPVAWRTPPRQYGAWETVTSNITEGLVDRGWDVTLFATKDSITKAKLHAVIVAPRRRQSKVIFRVNRSFGFAQDRLT